MSSRPRVQWIDPAAEAMLRALAAEEPEDWRDFALCAQADPDAFFPDSGGSTRNAKKVCRMCDVRAECLQYALHHNIRDGIWGGLSEQERRVMRRSQEVASGGERTCTGCGETKPVTEFHRRTRSGYEHRCKTCRRAARRERWAENAA